MTRRARLGAAVAACIAGALLLGVRISAQAPRPYELRGVDGLIRVYDYILDARFDQAEAELQRACGPAPPEACDVLDATALWWRIQLDPDNRALDERLGAAIDRAIRTTHDWTERDPDNPEAWFYQGGAYGVRVQFRVLRDEKLAAARDGKRIKESLERALELAPGLEDAQFGIGLYQYYAATAPAPARFLRFLLMLPGGDRKEGLARMQRTHNRGRLLQGEADYQLHLIYLWYEHRTDRAVALLESLRQRYPGNPYFISSLAEVQRTYLHDLGASLQTWRMLLAAAREQRVNEAPLAETRARLAIASELDTLFQTDRAIEQLEAAVELRPARPYGALADAWLALGEAHDRLGDRADAVAAYREAVVAAPPGDPHDVRRRAADGQKRGPDRERALAYRLSLDGWRRLEHGDLNGAAVALARSLALDARDPVAHYRYGRVLQAQHDDVGAVREFEQAVRGANEAPAPIAAAAWLEAGRVHERLGHTERARACYAAARTWFGGGSDTRDAASRALTRLDRR